MASSVLNAHPLVNGGEIEWRIDAERTAMLPRNATPGQRLTALRKAAGYPQATTAARAMSVSIVTYQHHENGTRNISRKSAEIYGHHYGVSAGLILWGEQPENEIEVPVVGAIVQSGKVLPQQDMPSDWLRSTRGPPLQSGAVLQAMVIMSAALYPAYRVGDLVFFAQASTAPPSVHGAECVVETMLGEQVLCIPHVMGEGLWTLTGYGGVPPVVGVRLRSAAPVLWVRKAAIVPAAGTVHS